MNIETIHRGRGGPWTLATVVALASFCLTGRAVANAPSVNQGSSGWTWKTIVGAPAPTGNGSNGYGMLYAPLWPEGRKLRARGQVFSGAVTNIVGQYDLVIWISSSGTVMATVDWVPTTGPHGPNSVAGLVLTSGFPGYTFREVTLGNEQFNFGMTITGEINFFGNMDPAGSANGDPTTQPSAPGSSGDGPQAPTTQPRDEETEFPDVPVNSNPIELRVSMLSLLAGSNGGGAYSDPDSGAIDGEEFIMNWSPRWYRESSLKPWIDAVAIGFSTLASALMAWKELRRK